MVEENQIGVVHLFYELIRVLLQQNHGKQTEPHPESTVTLNSTN